MIKTEYWEKYSSDMQYDLYGAQKNIGKLLRNRKKPVNKTIRINNISEEEWRTHFGSLYSAEITDNNNNIDKKNRKRIEESQEELTLEVHEVHSATKNLRNQ